MNMVLISRSSWDAAASLLAMAAAALIAFFSALLFLATPLLIWGLTLEPEPGLWSVAWMFAFLVALFFNITTAVQVFRDPAWPEAAKMAAVSGIAIGACPLWY